MPDWGKILKEIRESLVEAAREANARQQARRTRPIVVQHYEPNVCLFWDCKRTIRPEHVFCDEHYQEFQDGLIDECPRCGLAKGAQYDVCLDCYRSRRDRAVPAQTTQRNNWYKPEYSPAWGERDATADRFFVYILKLDGGQLYAGQTRELRERLSEHKDGGVQSTKGRNPKLVWLVIVSTRETAATVEVDIKKLIDSNPREIRRMVVGFRDLVRELDYS